MQLTDSRPNQAAYGNSPLNWKTKLGWFSIGPLTGLIIGLTLLLLGSTNYTQQHQNRIYTGISVAGLDLSRMTQPEAEVAIQSWAPLNEPGSVTFVHPENGRRWSYSFEQLGLALDTDSTASTALAIGRETDNLTKFQSQFESWYYGTRIEPIYVLNESQLFLILDQIAADIDTAPRDAAIRLDGETVRFESSRLGQTLDKTAAYESVMGLLDEMQSGEIELLIHSGRPTIFDATQASQEIEYILGSPIDFYLQQPLDANDLTRISLDTTILREWLRISPIAGENGTTDFDIFIDEIALRGWLLEQAPKVSREPENARFYFDDPTGELVLVEPHVNGRELDIDTTIDRFKAQIKTPNRSVALAIQDIVPEVHSGVTAAELGITQLLSEKTTWFSGSTNNRKHNIARAASNFFGIIIAPGEQFSFNRYLGDVSEEEGYETGLIILGGKTIEGVGGGVCQVSTTLFQTAFWAGLDLGQRLEHGYRVGYYDDGEGPGMDATVYVGLVDFTFTNNTPNYLLVENYYNEQFESLTFKIYSSDIGRVVEKSGPLFEDVQEPPEDEWIYNPELEPGTIRQVEHAAEGARVTVERIVYNFEGEIRDQDRLVSNYIPWNNVYEYGDGIDPENLPRNWRDLIIEEL